VVRVLKAAVAVGLVVMVAACGSRLDPETVAQAGGQQPGVNGATDPAALSGDQDDIGPGGTNDDTGTGPQDDSDQGAGTDTPTGPGSDPTDQDPTGGAKKASCEGFKNQTGVTDDKIVIANVADISGPVPGLFEAAQLAARAYVEFFNSQGDICGRKLELLPLDGRSDAGGVQVAYATACEDAFAVVGAVGAFDFGGAGTAEDCGIPDIRSLAASTEVAQCKVCYATLASKPHLITKSLTDFFTREYKDATESVGILAINAGAAPEQADNYAALYDKAGWDVKYEAKIDVAEFNFAPYVQQLKDNDVKLVQYMGPYQNTIKLQQAMQQQGYEPDVFLQDPLIYDQRYVDQAGSLADGVFVFSTLELFSDTSIPEMQAYTSWLQQVKPGAVPNFSGLYAWSAARLFVETAVGLGGDLSRSSMLSAISKVKGWTGNGLHVPQDVGGKTTSPCIKIIRYDGGWKQVSPGKFMCSSLVDTGLGS